LAAELLVDRDGVIRLETETLGSAAFSNPDEPVAIRELKRPQDQREARLRSDAW
jgi:hypothetical protein